MKENKKIIRKNKAKRIKAHNNAVKAIKDRAKAHKEKMRLYADTFSDEEKQYMLDMRQKWERIYSETTQKKVREIFKDMPEDEYCKKLETREIMITNEISNDRPFEADCLVYLGNEKKGEYKVKMEVTNE